MVGPFSFRIDYAVRVAMSWLTALAGCAGPLAADESPAARPKVVLEWGHKGDEPGTFHSPVCVAINARNELAVADLNNSRIQRFDANGKFLSAFDLPVDKEPRKSCIVGGLAYTSEGTLLVAFMVQHRIAAYSPEGAVLYEWGKKGAGDGEFNQPGGIVVRGDGEILVADQCNHRVQIFSPRGEYRGQWGSHGSAPGQFGGTEKAGSRFGGPHFLGQDAEGRLYTTEGGPGRIQQVSADGRPLAAWGSKTVEPGAFGEFQFGSQPGTFGPIGLLVDRRGRVWVTSLNDRVQCFTADGRFLFRMDGTDDDHPFLHPHGMAEDGDGFVYILDSGNQRIVKVDPRP